jgi:prepilin-type N-terminal cleavage/methylation domain-containing protein
MNRLTKSKHASTEARRQGFSILELVVAMALIGMLVLAVYGAITSGMGTMRMARENLRATQILLEKMEAMRLYNWDQLNPSFVPPQFIANYDVNSASTNSGILYYGTVEIAKADTGTTYAGDMKQVTVRIRWKTGAINRTRAMSTYVCRSGIQNYVY